MLGADADADVLGLMVGEVIGGVAVSGGVSVGGVEITGLMVGVAVGLGVSALVG